jgi:death-on-curing protein
MAEPAWLDRELLLALYEDVVAASGGAIGVRDEGLLESAPARPVNRFLYEDCKDLVELAATYAVAISANHPFVDGNKRIAFVAIGQFLEDNGFSLAAAPKDATRVMLAVAAGALGLDEVAAWLRTVVTTA